MTATKTSFVTIVGKDADRDAELAMALETRFEPTLKPVTHDAFDVLAESSIDILLAFDDPDSPELVRWISELYTRRPLPIALFSANDDKDKIHDAIAAGVSSYIYDGYRPSRVPAIIETVIARFEQRRSLEDELASARQDLDDRKIIDRAKGLVMAQRGCTEEEAYATLRKQAMDGNRKIADFAKDVLMVSEVLKGKSKPSLAGRKTEVLSGAPLNGEHEHLALSLGHQANGGLDRTMTSTWEVVCLPEWAFSCFNKLRPVERRQTKSIQPNVLHGNSNRR
jgi:response regulator NasT